MIWQVLGSSSEGHFIWKEPQKMLAEPQESELVKSKERELVKPKEREKKVVFVSEANKIVYTFDGTEITIEKSNIDEAKTEGFAEITASFISAFPHPLFLEFDKSVKAQIGGLAHIYLKIVAQKFINASIVVSFSYKNKGVRYAAWFKDL